MRLHNKPVCVLHEYNVYSSQNISKVLHCVLGFQDDSPELWILPTDPCWNRRISHTHADLSLSVCLF